uniref:Ig-like domain-containing protein n=1 Tax=Callorhinchus milii TaxID=7868 RepID=A0A4W3GKC6_CALMI
GALQSVYSQFKFTVTGPALPVPAIAGSDVVLDCKCSIDLPREGVEVRWFRTRYDSPVHLYKEGRQQLETQDEAYRHRTQLFVEEFINGDVSLRLGDVRVSDNGAYTCFVDYGEQRCNQRGGSLRKQKLGQKYGVNRLQR